MPIEWATGLQTIQNRCEVHAELQSHSPSLPVITVITVMPNLLLVTGYHE